MQLAVSPVEPGMHGILRGKNGPLWYDLDYVQLAGSDEFAVGVDLSHAGDVVDGGDVRPGIGGVSISGFEPAVAEEALAPQLSAVGVQAKAAGRAGPGLFDNDPGALGLLRADLRGERSQEPFSRPSLGPTGAPSASGSYAPGVTVKKKKVPDPFSSDRFSSCWRILAWKSILEAPLGRWGDKWTYPGEIRPWQPWHMN